MVYVGECLAYVFPLSFIVSSLISRSLIHFEFILGYGGRNCSNFTLFQVFKAALIEGTVRFSKLHLLKGLSCLSLYFLSSLVTD